MNIIRTPAVELSTIPAIAYKQKLSAGGAGLKIHHLEHKATAVFTIDKRTNQLQPYGAVDANLFPEEAVNEALELTLGLPYSARGKINVTVFEVKDAEDVTENEIEDIDMVDSDEYSAIVERYTSDKGKMDYTHMNKDFIQFAAKSKIVNDLVAARADEDTIVAHVIKNRAAYLAEKKESLSDAEVAALIETLDEIDPRSAFKELKNHIRRMLAR